MHKTRHSIALLFVLLSTAMLASLILTDELALAASAADPSHLYPAAQGADQPSLQSRQTPTQPTSTGSAALLPMVFNGKRTCPEQSPFSIEIAALHQIVPIEAGMANPEERSSHGEEGRKQPTLPDLTGALKSSGACWSRVRIDWAEIQPEPPAPHMFWTYHDEKLRLVAEAGVRLIVIVDGVPEWAGNPPFGPIDRKRLDEFSRFLTALVSRYKEPPYNVLHWELFNEPDLTTSDGVPAGWGLMADRYAEMLAVAYPAIKAADPQAKVLMGGVAYDWFTEYGGPFYRYFPDDVVLAGGGENLDVINFHYFPPFAKEWERWDPNSEDRRSGRLPAPTCGIVDDAQGIVYEAGGIDLIAKTSHFRNRLATCYGLNKPTWVTELAESGHAGDPASLAKQARYVIQGYARGLAAGAENITWYALISPPYDPFGQGLLYSYSGAPKPAFYAYQTMTRELAGYTYAYTLTAEGVEAYIFRNPQQHEKTVAWSLDPEEPVLLAFIGASDLRVVDRNGNVKFVEDGRAGDADGTTNGSVSLRTTADPLFVSR
jgi:hypothetical protein